jgi:lipid-A-disaccharide synthase
LEIFLVAAKESGDRLGAALLRALRQCSSEPLWFSGVGGREMAAAGLVSLLPMDDFAIIGFSAIPGRLPRIVSHMARVVRAVLTRRPHALVIIDSPAYVAGCAFRALARPLDPDHRLRVAIGLGGAGACDETVCRPHPGAAAVRARRAS